MSFFKEQGKLPLTTHQQHQKPLIKLITRKKNEITIISLDLSGLSPESQGKDIDQIGLVCKNEVGCEWTLSRPPPVSISKNPKRQSLYSRDYIK